MVAGIRILQVATVITVLLLGTGCAVKHTRTPNHIHDLDIDPSFTWSKVDSHDIGVLAVVIWDENLGWTQRILGTQLRDTLIAGPLIRRTQALSQRVAYHNPFWNVVSTTELADSIGWKTYSKLIGSYATSGDFSDDEVRLLELSLRDRLRYLAVARIEDHVTRKWQSMNDGGDETDYYASRSMILDYKIYDLWYRNLVWAGWVEEEELNESTVSDYEYDSDAGFLANLIGSFANSAVQPRPKVPEFDPMLEASFVNLAQSLFPPVPFLYEGPPNHALRCSLCPDMPGKFEFGEQDVTLRLDDDKIYLRWADGSETKLKKKVDGELGEVRCGYCGSAYSWESEWMTLAADGLPEH